MGMRDLNADESDLQTMAPMTIHFELFDMNETIMEDSWIHGEKSKVKLSTNHLLATSHRGMKE